jgi:tripartite-type tricarboxylate transporter receptor subunit TctC
MSPTRRQFLVSVAAVGTAATTVSGAFAQSYPQRPVSILIPFAPGGGTDVVARAMAPAFSAKLGQPSCSKMSVGPPERSRPAASPVQLLMATR